MSQILGSLLIAKIQVFSGRNSKPAGELWGNVNGFSDRKGKKKDIAFA